MVAAACACATGILGWYVRKPDRSARLGLTLFAVAGLRHRAPRGRPGRSFVAAGAAMLWMVPAREWFATGRWTPPAPAPEKARGTRRRSVVRRRRAGGGQAGRRRLPRRPPSQARRRPRRRPDPSASTAPPADPTAAQPAARPSARRSAARASSSLHERPGAMVAAFVITVVTAGGLLAMSLLWVAIAGLSPEFLMTRARAAAARPVRGRPHLRAAARHGLRLCRGAFIVWCIVALVLAGFAMARRDWARRGLMVVAAFSAGGCLVFVVTTPCRR